MTYDFIVVGAGVVGCAVTRRFALEGASVLLVEKAADILEGASKGNSAILHTGFDAPSGSLEQRCIAEGYRQYLAIHDRFNLPLVRSGAMVIAWDPAQLSRLDAIVEQAHANGVGDVARVSGGDVVALEPALGPGVLGAVHIPGEILDRPVEHAARLPAAGTRA